LIMGISLLVLGTVPVSTNPWKVGFWFLHPPGDLGLYEYIVYMPVSTGALASCKTEQ
jgi:hypothetical protein